jgi:hypothetical protein
VNIQVFNPETLLVMDVVNLLEAAPQPCSAGQTWATALKIIDLVRTTPMTLDEASK